MHALTSALVALIRPARGLDRAGDALKWLWLPLAAVLVTSVVVKAVVAAPLQATAQQEQARLALEESMKDMPQADREQLQRDLEQAGGLEAATTIASTAAVVFGVVGAVVAILYVGTFFFLAAKTWANPVAYRTTLSVAGLALVPHAIRNFIQAAYMATTGIWLQHPGLGALVAPKDALTPPSTAYAFLAQVDAWVVWGLAILYFALRSETVGFDRKRAVTSMATFVGITALFQAVPTIVSGVFMGAAGM